MRMFSTTKLIVASGGVALALTTGAGIASAQPDVDVIVNSTCTYPQVMAALNAQDPAMGKQVSANPALTAGLQQLVADSPDGRRRTVQQWQGVPALQPYIPLITSVATSCNNF
jgi:hemophore-related protein